MTMPTKRLIDEISQTVPKHEIPGLIEALVFVRESRLILLQEAFRKEVSVVAAKLQLSAEPQVRSPSRYEVRGREEHGQL